MVLMFLLLVGCYSWVLLSNDVVYVLPFRFDEIESKMGSFLKSSGYNVKRGKLPVYCYLILLV